jgi:hypothetical protein
MRLCVALVAITAVSASTTDTQVAVVAATMSSTSTWGCPCDAANCIDGVKEVHYKRITNTGSYNPYSVLIDAWIQTDNTLGTDFELHSTYEDAIAGRNKWNYCNYDPNVAFPRDCGPTSNVGGQWATRTNGLLNIGWPIEPTNPVDTCEDLRMRGISASGVCLLNTNNGKSSAPSASTKTAEYGRWSTRSEPAAP